MGETSRERGQSLEPAEGVRGLIFDLDGTLIDSLEMNWQAMRKGFAHYGITIDRDEFVLLTGRSLEEIVEILLDRHYGAHTAEMAADIVRRKREDANSHINDVKPIEVVADVARRNRGKMKMAVGTGSDRHRAVKMLESTGLLELFDVVVSADEVERHKPAPDTFVRCAELMGVEVSECQVYEDGEQGLAAARACGMYWTDVRGFI